MSLTKEKKQELIGQYGRESGDTGSAEVQIALLTERIGELQRNRPIIVHCAGGYRSSIAASLLMREGLSPISELAGGIAAWDAAGLPSQSA